MTYEFYLNKEKGTAIDISAKMLKGLEAKTLQAQSKWLDNLRSLIEEHCGVKTPVVGINYQNGYVFAGGVYDSIHIEARYR